MIMDIFFKFFYCVFIFVNSILFVYDDYDGFICFVCIIGDMFVLFNNVFFVI